jgi:hypothetical protein
MAYSEYSLAQLDTKFGIKNRQQRLFKTVVEIEPSEKLKDAMSLLEELPTRSEKAKSKLIVMPILLELRAINNKFFTIYSGENLNADDENGLKGECDFILAKDIHTFDLNYPIIQIVEAKKNDLEIGVPQCAAQLLGTRIFNEKKGIYLDKIYGCVTTGDDWLFMVLEKEIIIDTRKYSLVKIGEILGVFQEIMDYYKGKLNL